MMILLTVSPLWFRCVIVMTFWYVFIGTDLTFSNFLKLYSSLGIDHDSYVLYVHMTYVYSFMIFSSHEYTAKRSRYRIMIFYRLRSTILRTHHHPHFLPFPPQPHHPCTPHPRRTTRAPLGEGSHQDERCDHPADHDCT